MNINISSAYERTLRHGFEFFYRAKHGYYPSWDERSCEYMVATTQKRWNHWKSFFQSYAQPLMETISPYQMASLYTSTDHSADNEIEGALNV